MKGKIRPIIWFILSNDLCGAFFVSKKVFESAPVVQKETKFGKDKFRNIAISSGRLFVKKDGLWKNA
jgi:hypothetical protein